MGFDGLAEPEHQVVVDVGGVEPDLDRLGLSLPQIVEGDHLVRRQPHAAVVGGDPARDQQGAVVLEERLKLFERLGKARTSIWPSRSSSWNDPHQAPFFDFRLRKSVTIPPTDTSVPEATSRSPAVRCEAKSSSNPLKLSSGCPLT